MVENILRSDKYGTLEERKALAEKEYPYAYRKISGFKNQDDYLRERSGILGQNNTARGSSNRSLVIPSLQMSDENQDRTFDNIELSYGNSRTNFMQMQDNSHTWGTSGADGDYPY
jgi:hypothetical protein